MIPIPNPIEEPSKFDERCRKAGAAWLKDNPNCERPTDKWTPFRHALADGFSNRCAFGAMYIPSGTVDHFVSWKEDNSLAYEWANFRYVEGWVNSSKNKKEASLVLDPFVVGEGWFEILLPSMQLVATDLIPDEFKELAKSTLEKLPIRDDERILRVRREWYRMYEEEELTLEGLRKKAPLIAAAVEKKNAQDGG
ncbi:hypothetical protein GGD92_14640 [Pseudomonas protegens]|uniref:HNH endonuclease n=1 Tax=Pseudomonas protegens TaxID=380021 RepID=A0A7G7XHH2_9PSED|nr:MULTISPECIES: hypothetical protein [Pseudomonas]QNH79417.1 hypothetical protein GGI48_09715 [Pseudomonas protegens]QNL08614.1 hypothetical protein GGD92_14640 [Pseudomonas protegens]